MRDSVESEPDAVPIAALGLRGMAPQPITVDAHHGIEPLAIAARVNEALAQTGSIATPAGDAVIESWLLLDPSLDLTVRIGNQRYSCWSSADSPSLGAENGKPEAGLATASELAARIQRSVDWAVASCRPH